MRNMYHSIGIHLFFLGHATSQHLSQADDVHTFIPPGKHCIEIFFPPAVSVGLIKDVTSPHMCAWSEPTRTMSAEAAYLVLGQ